MSNPGRPSKGAIRSSSWNDSPRRPAPPRRLRDPLRSWPALGYPDRRRVRPSALGLVHAPDWPVRPLPAESAPGQSPLGAPAAGSESPARPGRPHREYRLVPMALRHRLHGAEPGRVQPDLPPRPSPRPGARASPGLARLPRGPRALRRRSRPGRALPHRLLPLPDRPRPSGDGRCRPLLLPAPGALPLLALRPAPDAWDADRLRRGPRARAALQVHGPDPLSGLPSPRLEGQTPAHLPGPDLPDQPDRARRRLSLPGDRAPSRGLPVREQAPLHPPRGAPHAFTRRLPGRARRPPTHQRRGGVPR